MALVAALLSIVHTAPLGQAGTRKKEGRESGGRASEGHGGERSQGPCSPVLCSLLETLPLTRSRRHLFLKLMFLDPWV